MPLPSVFPETVYRTAQNSHVWSDISTIHFWHLQIQKYIKDSYYKNKLLESTEVILNTSSENSCKESLQCRILICTNILQHIWCEMLPAPKTPNNWQAATQRAALGWHQYATSTTSFNCIVRRVSGFLPFGRQHAASPFHKFWKQLFH